MPYHPLPVIEATPGTDVLINLLSTTLGSHFKNGSSERRGKRLVVFGLSRLK